jgi:hypothetical protein
LVWAGEGGDDVEPVGPVAGVAPLPPGAAEVFDFDPGGSRVSWQRTVKVRPRDWVCKMALAASSSAMRMRSSAAGQLCR